MTTAYTSLLGLALPVTGELSGTWGDTVNDYITKYLDASVAGTQTISGSQTAVTLSVTTNANLSQVGSGATGSAQYNIINCTGNPASMLTVTVPAASKTYVVVNATSTNQQVKIVGAGPTTGVTLDAGEKAVIAWNGSDFIKIATSAVDGVSTISFGTTGLTPSTATSGAVTVAGTLVAANGGTGQSSYTTGDLLYATGSTALSKLGIGTNGQILTSTGTAPQWSTLSGVAVTTFSAGTTGFTPSVATSGAITLAGTLATTNGGTGLTSFTANGVVYASSSSALTTGSALSFDGTNLGLGTVTATGLGRTFAIASAASSNRGFLFKRADTNADTAFLYSDDNNLYLGCNAGPVIFSANNSEQMRLTSTGLGIGTSSPGSRLNVVGGSVTLSGTASFNSEIFQEASAKRGLIFGYETASQVGIIASHTNGNPSNLAFWTFSGSAWGERMRLDSSGNLTLASPGTFTYSSGTANGVAYLNGSKVLTTGSAFRFDGSQLYINGGAGGIPLYLDSVSGGNANIAFGENGVAKWYLRNIASNGGFSFYDVNTASEAMRLTSTGLGIGTSSPTTKLQVEGGAGNAWARFTNTANTSGLFVGTSSGGEAIVYQQGNNYLAFYTNALERLRLSADGTFRVKGAGTAGSTDAVQFAGSAPASSLTLDASGNLGVGTASPSEKLHVVGNSRTVGDINAWGSGGTVQARLTAIDAVGYAYIGTISNHAFLFYTNSAERAHIPSAGGFVVGTAALATNATTGFLYVPTCAGTPTGTPATQTGTAPIVVDTTNNKLYFYSGGQWRDAGP